jgi:myo-inositol 2-dehydrogenase/D-chiro-inositol 1-dehydrogenase
MKKAKIGIIGLGELGAVHAANIAFRIPNTELAGVCATTRERVDKYCKEFDVGKGYTDFNEFLAKTEMDGVVIASSTSAHREHALAAIKAGIHVFIEKPTGLNTEECLAIEKAAESSDKIFTVGFMRRFDPSYAEAKKRIEAGEIGDPIFYRGHSLDPYYVAEYLAKRSEKAGCWFIDMTVHDYDLARWFLGSEAECVYACGGAYIYEVFATMNDVDNGFALMKFKDGKAAFYYSSKTAAHGAHVETEIVGTKGAIRINGVPRRNRLEMFTRDGVTEQCFGLYLERWAEAYCLEVQDFADAILQGRKPLITAHDATVATHMGEIVQQSYLQNKQLFF